jgi:hypothetical protein
VQGEELRFDLTALQPFPYGPDCGNVAAVAGVEEPSLAGHEFFDFELLNGSQIAALMLGVTPVFGPLDLIGMPGCTLLVNPDATIPAALTGRFGNPRVELPLSDSPSGVGLTIYAQWVWVAPGANTLGVLASGGMRVLVR